MARNRARIEQGFDGAPLYHIVLVRDVATPGESRGATVVTPDDVVDLCSDMADSDREVFAALMLNTKNRVIARVTISVGSLNASIVHPRELFGPAVVCKAASVVLVHNHPSGDPMPSGADTQLTRRIGKAGDILGIDVLDSVVVARDPATHEMRFASLAEMGLM